MGMVFAQTIHAPLPVMGGIVGLFILGSLLPDLDHPKALLTMALFPVGPYIICPLIRKLSVALGGPPHRGISHGLPAIFLFCGLSAVGTGLWVPWWVWPSIFLGMVVHDLGDLPTLSGLALFGPISWHEFHVPEMFRFRVGGNVETMVITPVLYVATVVVFPGVLPVAFDVVAHVREAVTYATS